MSYVRENQQSTTENGKPSNNSLTTSPPSTGDKISERENGTVFKIYENEEDTNDAENDKQYNNSSIVRQSIKEYQIFPADDVFDINEIPLHLTSYLRVGDLRSKKRVKSIFKLRNYCDPYTNEKFSLDTDDIDSDHDVDHIHEAQVIAAAILRTSELAPRISNVLLLNPLRDVLNDSKNLTITPAKINRSKGQAVRFYLNHLDKKSEMPLLSAFIQTAVGKERYIAQFAHNIVKVIQDSWNDVSENMRETKPENGNISGQIYVTLADNFDHIVEKMQLDWNEGIKLRNGRIYCSSNK
ncbi:unnamed protein product [Didymodactylos carnosus]|uniref:Uncharacterized protein n=1 Tax=Didymodactylos carnosus TaxID=1234261 RepID=A0A814D2U1_9BILA|nr:unnamed protein product [Didymodactylos carnosus]CAF1084738.1 unnamed protein product [Didymodactylos carnosus]CAF3724610.1 unnamed protein product [Didymodactylos carnosus]CAF3847272.1 unnamed protein product [Didymodactylos carnosus]